MRVPEKMDGYPHIISGLYIIELLVPWRIILITSCIQRVAMKKEIAGAVMPGISEFVYDRIVFHGKVAKIILTTLTCIFAVKTTCRIAFEGE